MNRLNNYLCQSIPAIIPTVVFAFACAVSIFAQTSSFTYQGRLTDSSAQANGSYDFGFALFDAPTGGNQIGAAQTRATVGVVNGIFTVQLDFGATAFPGEKRFLQIAAKKTTEVDYTTLQPRQPINSTPYAMRALNAASADNAAQLGGAAANQFVQTTDARLSDSRTPNAGSNNYIQNTTTKQSLSNFSIAGTGAANVFNAATQYNIGNQRVLSAPGDNTFVGRSAGASNTTGGSNSFFGASAGQSMILGSNNSFFGTDAGRSGTGAGNSFFGRSAGFDTTSGAANAFFGLDAGRFNTTGGGNAFFGTGAGAANTTGGSNTALGSYANFGANNLEFATAVGANALVSASDTIVLGKVAGTYGGAPRSADAVQIPGSLSVSGTLSASGAGLTNLNASNITAGTLDSGRLGVVPIAKGGTGSATQNFVDLSTNQEALLGGLIENKTFVSRIRAYGDLQIDETNVTGLIFSNVNNGNNDKIFYAGGINGLVFSAGDDFQWYNVRNNRTNMYLYSNGNLGIVGEYLQISDARYKTDVQTFGNALAALRRLRGVTFNWQPELNKPTGRQIGFIAQEVEQVLPEIVETDRDGYKSVAYANAVPVLVEAIKEQQAQLDDQRKQFDEQQALTDKIKRLICITHPTAAVCRESK